MIFICFVNLNLLIGIINVFLLKVKTNNVCAKKGYQDCFPYGKLVNNQGRCPWLFTNAYYLFIFGNFCSSNIINIIVHRIIQQSKNHN